MRGRNATVAQLAPELDPMIQLARVLTLLALLAPALPAQVVLTFDTFPAMSNSPGATVPAAARLSNQYETVHGVRFSSLSSFVAVIVHGVQTPSVPNIIGGTSATGALSYLAPLHMMFVDPANPSGAATTNFVSIRGDLTPIAGTATMRAFALDGTQIGSVTAPDAAGGVLLSLSVPGIHRVEVTQTSGTIGMDNFTFNAVTPCSPIQRYCTAGTTTNGCVPALSASGTARAAATSGFVVTAQGVEGQKQGLLFYGLQGGQAQAWGSGSSFLCVKSPTQRSSPTNSGGTADACNGALALDWCAFVAANPSALGAPFSGGEQVSIQAWFRDPAAPLSTNLSDALTFVVCP